jgi:hypothetical protein
MPTLKKTRSILGGVLVVLMSPAGSPALDLAPREPALRLGVSFGPDQLLGGVQAALGPDRSVGFRPGFDYGAGNGVRIGSFNGDVVFRFARPVAGLRPYLGAGPGLNLVDVTDGVGEADGVEAKLVGHVLGGLVRTRPLLGIERLFLEVRGGLGDTPDVKVTVGGWF